MHRSIAAALGALAATMVTISIAVSASTCNSGYCEPQFKNQVLPQYPDTARSANETGDVRAKVLVTLGGTARSVSIFKSSGHKDLDDAVVAALKKSTYKPATSNGKAMMAFYDLTYKFTLQGVALNEGSTSDLAGKLAANPNDVATRMTYGTLLINGKKYKEAEDVFAKGVELAPSNAKMWGRLGIAYYSDGINNKANEKFKPAAEALDKALALDPKLDTGGVAPAAYGRYAYTLILARDFKGALPYAGKAASLEPKEIQYKIELGEAQQGSGDSTTALATFKTAQAMDTKKDANVSARILTDIGLTQLDLGQESDGVAAINEAERVSPSSPDPYQALASYYIRKGKLDAAITPLSQLAQLQPNNTTAQVDLGDIYVTRKQYDLAKAAYAKALAINPKEAGALLGSAQIAAAQGDFAGADSALTRAIAADPKSAAPFNAQVATVLLNQAPGRVDYVTPALKYANAATSADPNYPTGWYDQGVALARQQKKDQANLAFHKAFDLFKAQNNKDGMIATNDRFKELNGANISGFDPGRSERTNQATNPNG